MHRHAGGLADRVQARHDRVRDCRPAAAPLRRGSWSGCRPCCSARSAAPGSAASRRRRRRRCAPISAMPGSFSWMTSGPRWVRSSRMWSLCSPTPRPSRISIVIDAADHVARREVLHARRVALHEALAVAVAQDAAFAAHAFGDQAAGAVDAGRVELHELHVLQRQAGAQRHAAAVAGAGVRRGRGEVRAAVAAGREHRALRAEQVQRAFGHVEREHAAAGAVGVHDQVEREVLDEELRVVRQRLLVQRVQDRVAGAVGGGAGALRRRAFAVARGHAAERALVDLAVLGARERHAVVLELDDRRDRLACTCTRSRPGRPASPSP